MKPILVCLFSGWLAWGSWSARAAEAQTAQAPSRERFAALDVLIDAGTRPLAAYQLTVAVTNGQAKIVGIEGGTHPAFKEPPYYDPKAIQRERVILAAFSTAPADQLPQRSTRVATIHLLVTGPEEPEFSATLQAAADANGERIVAQATLNPRTRQ